MGAAWTAALCDPSGRELEEVTEAFRLSFLRRRYSEAAFDGLLGTDLHAAIRAQLPNGLPRLKAWRDGTLRFNGAWAPMQEHEHDVQEGTGSSLRAIFRDPFYACRNRHSDALVEYADEDAGDIAWDLIDRENAKAPTGIRLASIEATRNRTRTYEHAEVADAIVRLSEVRNGFDFALDPVDEGEVIAALRIAERLGQDRSATVAFERGPGTLANVLDIQRMTYPPVNVGIVLGEDGLYGYAEDAASIEAWGRWSRREMAAEGTTEQATLDDRAEALLHPALIEVVSFRPDPETAPQPWDDYWIGDNVALRAKGDLAPLSLTPRVNGVEVAVSKDGEEDEHRVAIEQEEVTHL